MNRGIVEGDMESARSVDVETMKYLRSIQQQRADGQEAAERPFIKG